MAAEDACRQLIAWGNTAFENYMGVYHLEEGVLQEGHVVYKHETEGKNCLIIESSILELITSMLH